MNERRQEQLTDDQVKRMVEIVFGVTAWPTNRGSDGEKPVRESPSKSAPVPKPDAVRQPGSGLDKVRIREVNGERFIARDANDVFKASSARSTSNRIPGRK